jgi:hypothetical protein
MRRSPWSLMRKRGDLRGAVKVSRIVSDQTPGVLVLSEREPRNERVKAFGAVTYTS